MAEGIKTSITVTDPGKPPWNKPGSQQWWYTIAVEEIGEPLKFIQDKAKGAPAPIIGQSYDGIVYEDPGKFGKFYPSIDRQGSPTPVADVKSGFTPAAEKAYLKDISDIPDRMIGRLLQYYDVQTLIGDDGKASLQYNNMMVLAMELSNDAIRMIESVRDDGKVEQEITEAQAEAAEKTTKSFADQWKNKTVTANEGDDDPGPGDDDAPGDDDGE